MPSHHETLLTGLLLQVVECPLPTPQITYVHVTALQGCNTLPGCLLPALPCLLCSSLVPGLHLGSKLYRCALPGSTWRHLYSTQAAWQHDERVAGTQCPLAWRLAFSNIDTRTKGRAANSCDT